MQSVENINNLNEYNNSKVNQFYPVSGDYENLENNEAYVVKYDNSSYKIKNDSQINLNLKGDSHNLKVKSLGYSQEFLYPTNMIHEETLANVPGETWIGTDNIVVYVNEETFYNIIYSLYFYENINQWDSGVYNTYLSSVYDGDVSAKSPKLVEYSFFISMPSFYYDKESVIQKYWNSDILVENKYSQTFNETYNFISPNSEIYYAPYIQATSKALDGNGLKQKLIDDYGINLRNVTNSDNGYPATNSPFYSSMYIDDFVYSNYNQTASYIISSENVSSIFFIFMIVIGFITTIILISKDFKSKIKPIGILKAEGYSQSTISLIILSDIIMIVLISLMLALIILPLFNLIWSSSVTSLIATPVPLYALDFLSFITYMVFPSTLFIGFSFIMLRFYYIRKPTLKLVKDEINNKPNFILQEYDKSKKLNNFSIDLSLSNLISTFSKSFIIFAVSFSIFFFILTWFATDSIPENTSKQLANLWTNSDLTLINNISDTKYSEQIENDSYRKAIQDGSIKDYTFTNDQSTIDSLYNDVYVDTWCAAWDDTKEYIEKTPLNNSYISIDSMNNLNILVNSIPDDFSNDNDCGTMDRIEEYPDYFETLSYLNNGYYKFFDESSDNYNENLKGIANGKTVSNKGINEVFYFTLGSGAVSFSRYTNGNYYQSFSSNIMFASIEFYENVFSLDKKTQETLDQYIEISKQKDGKVYFLNGNISYHPTDVNDPNVSYTMTFDSDLSSTINDDSDDRLTIDTIDFANISLPFFAGTYLAIDDPDYKDLIPELDIWNNNLEIFNLEDTLPFVTSNQLQTSTSKDTPILGINDFNSEYMSLSFNVSNNSNLIKKLRNGDDVTLNELSNNLLLFHLTYYLTFLI